MRLRIGTRGSQLALWQANEAARLLGEDAEIVVVKTTGDKRRDVSLASIGGKGLFIKELEEALERDTIDVAVHSLKDVPSIIPDHFTLAAFLEREDARDVWVSPTPIADLPAGARVGTSAPRRRAQFAARYPHFAFDDIRGNVDTRIAKVHNGEYAGIVLAAAGLIRLGREQDIGAWFSLDEMVPAAGQGIVVMECLRDNARVREKVRTINHATSETAALCERGVLQKFGERLDCHSEIAVHATIDEEIVVRAFFHGVRVVRSGRDADALINDVYEELARQARSIS